MHIHPPDGLVNDPPDEFLLLQDIGRCWLWPWMAELARPDLKCIALLMFLIILFFLLLSEILVSYCCQFSPSSLLWG